MGIMCICIFFFFLRWIIAFRALLDNYEMDVTKQEVVTPQEEQENRNFLKLVVETPVMKEAHRFLVTRGRAPASVPDFENLLYKIWFKLYGRPCEDGYISMFVCITQNEALRQFL